MYQIRTTTPEDHVALLTFLYLAGYKYPSLRSLDEYNTAYGPFMYPHVLIYEDKDLGGNYYHNADCGEELVYPQDITEIFTRVLQIKPAQVLVLVVKDVGDYQAAITKDGITVGCQNISFEKFEEISKAVAAVKK